MIKWKELKVVVAYFKTLFQCLCGRTEETHENPIIEAKIQASFEPRTS
jgi:hypothetical protein